MLFQNCVPINGSIRGAVYDLGKDDYFFVSNNTIDKIKINKISQNLLEDEFDILIKNDCIGNVPTSIQENFPKLSLEWSYPSIISNVIVDIIFLNSIENIELFFKMMSTLMVKSVVLIESQISDEIDIESFFANLKKTGIITIEILLSENLFKKNKETLYASNRIKNIVVYNCHETSQTLVNGINVVSKKEEINERSLFRQHYSYFNVNIPLFTESQKHNTYFNRKLYIGKNGEVKNAPECSDWFGFIQNTTLEELKDIIAMPKFQKYWYVHKELIDVCKDCEFRHMCVDNRVPLKRKKDEWYHDTECNYNPYIAKWKEEEGYKTLEDCGVTTDENGLQINHKQLEEINAQLWED